MTAIDDLNALLSSMEPELSAEETVFCTLPLAESGAARELNPLACFREKEGLTLILSKAEAQRARLSFSGSFRQITLTVHSSLQAIGLTAAVSGRLAREGISANIVAAYYHDHIFVPNDRAEQAMSALLALQSESG